MVEFILHYGEIALKGKNRPYFEKVLIRNIKQTVKSLPLKRLDKLAGRFLLQFADEVDIETTLAHLQRVLGVVSVARAWSTPADLSLLEQAIGKQLQQRQFRTFGIRPTRGDKRFPHTSSEVAVRVGKYVQDLTGADVYLDNPELPIYIELLMDQIFFYFEKHAGPGGLPLGASGKVVSLISGGIDSPVSTYLMMRRGCRVLLVHFHSSPFTSEESQGKVLELAKILTQFQPEIRIFMVPFASVQKAIITSVSSPYRIILYRRFMLRIAQELALREQAQALVTGDALGQVASQTLENLHSIGKATTLPILRPLVGMDKEEIIRWAKKIGTYECSIIPHSDCCSYLMPRKPLTHSTPTEVEQVESVLDIPGLVKQALADLEVHRICL